MDDYNDELEGKSRRILDSAAIPTHNPFPIPNMTATNRSSRTHTASGDTTRSTHTRIMKINTKEGQMETNAVVTTDIQDTLLSVRELTKHGSAIIFTQKYAYAIQKQKLKR